MAGAEKMPGKEAARGPGGLGGGLPSHICVRINWEEQLGSETDHAN